MLIIFLFICLILYRLFRIPDKRDKINLFVILTTSFILNILSLIAIQIEIIGTGNLGTIGSDTLEYYTKAIELLENPGDFISYLRKFAGGYTIFCYLILQTSFLKSPVLIAFGNIFLFLNIIVQLHYLLNQARVSTQVKIFSLLLIIFNGHIIWTTINVLKDILLLFLVLEIIFSLNVLTIKRNALLWIKLIGILIFAHYVRLYIEYILILIIFLTLYYKYISISQFFKKYNRRLKYYFLFVLLIGVLFYFINYEIINTKIYWYMHMAEENARNALKHYGSGAAYLFDLPLYQKLSLGYIRFILLPIPIKIFFSDYFLTWKILGFIGSSIWWLLGLYFMISLFKYFSYFTKPINIFKPFLIFVIILVTIYVIIYAGTGTSRLRIPMYIVGTIFGVFAIERLKIRNSVFVALLSLSIYVGINLLPLLLYFLS